MVLGLTVIALVIIYKAIVITLALQGKLVPANKKVEAKTTTLPLVAVISPDRTHAQFKTRPATVYLDELCAASERN